MTLIRTINKVLDSTVTTKATKNVDGQAGNVWVSLARYDDTFVDTLEEWEKYTRDPKDFGKRKKDSDHRDAENVTDLFKTDKWDNGKMVRSFAKLGRMEKKIVFQDEVEVSIQPSVINLKTYLQNRKHVFIPIYSLRWIKVNGTS